MKTILLRAFTAAFFAVPISVAAQISIDTFSVTPQGSSVSCAPPVLSVDSQSNVYTYSWVKDPAWAQIAGPVTSDTSYMPKVLVNGLGTPYVLSLDIGTNKYSVNYYNGSSWVPYGNSGFTPAGSNYGSFAIGSAGVCVAFMDAAYGGRASVMYSNGGTWSYLGTPGFSAGQARYEKIAYDQSTGNVYVAYEDVANGDKTTVMYYNGLTWTQLGGPVSAGGSDYQQLVVDRTGVVYVSYSDWTAGYGITVQKYTNFAWSVVGTTGFTGPAFDNDPLQIDDNNNLYLAYVDASNNYYLSVRKFDGASWVYVGTPGFSNAMTGSSSIDMRIDGAGLPYVCYTNTSGDLFVKRWTGLNWEDFGTPDSNIVGMAYHSSFALSPNGNPCMVYVDGGQNQRVFFKTFVGADQLVTTHTFTPSVVGNYTTVAYSNTGTTAYALNIVHVGLISHPEVVNMSPSAIATCSSATINATTQSCFNSSIEWIMNPIWDTVGFTTFSYGTGAGVNMDFGPGNVPYIVYQDASMANAGVVMTYNGSNWVNLGTNIAAPGGAADLDIAVGADGLPVISMRDNTAASKISVMKYDGTGWNYVGSAGISQYVSQNTSLALDRNGMPYVAFSEGAFGTQISVMKWNGTTWSYVGGAPVAAGGVPEIALDSNDLPYVIYKDPNNGGKATVQRFNGTNWVLVGTAGFTSGNVDNPNLVITRTGVPIAVYIDNGTGGKLTAMSYGVSGWAVMGSSPFTADNVSSLDLTIDGADVPYVACSMAPNGYATVYRYDGLNWQALGNTAFSSNTIAYPAIGIDTMGIPVVAFSDYNYMGFISAMKFDGTHVAGNTLTYTTSSAGTYYTTASLGQNGTLSLNSTTVTINPAPDTSVTMTSFPLALISGALNSTYQWINCTTGLPVAGATQGTFTPTANGSYAVVVTTSLGCVDTSSCYTVTGVGIEENNSALSFGLYPNPASEFVVLETAEACAIEVLDPSGRIVLNENSNGGKQELNVHALAAGIYFVRITDAVTGASAVRQLNIR